MRSQKHGPRFVGGGRMICEKCRHELAYCPERCLIRAVIQPRDTKYNLTSSLQIRKAILTIIDDTPITEVTEKLVALCDDILVVA
jgi:hypothetical protein